MASNVAPSFVPNSVLPPTANINITAVHALTLGYQHSVKLAKAYASMNSSGELGLPMPSITIQAQQAIQFATVNSLSQNLHGGNPQFSQMCEAMQSLRLEPQYHRSQMQQNQQETEALLQQITTVLQRNQQQSHVPVSGFHRPACPIKNRVVIAFARPDIPYFYFALNKFENRMEPHKCLECQTTVEEAHLRPLYTEYCEALQTKVLFVFNVITYRKEQYIYSVEYQGLEQVDRPEMTIDFTKTVHTSTIVGTLQGEGDDRILIEKDVFGGMKKSVMKKDGAIKKALPAPVTTLMGKEMKKAVARKEARKENGEEDDDIDDDEEGTNHAAMPVRPMKTVWCPHKRQEVVYAFSSADGIYIRFTYDEFEGKFMPFDCEGCPNQVMEVFLLPKYTKQVETENGDIVTIIYVYNEFTNRYEQYVFNPITWGFEQVRYPRHPYDPSKDSVTTVVHIEGPAIILKDPLMRMRKETYDTLEKRYVQIPPVPVKTLFPAMSGPRAMPIARVMNNNQMDDVDSVAEIKPEVLERAKRVVAGPSTPRVSEKEAVMEELRRLRKKLNSTQTPVTVGAPMSATAAKRAKKKAAVRAAAMAAAAQTPEDGVTVESLLKENADLLANPDKIMEQQAKLPERIPRPISNEIQLKAQDNKSGKRVVTERQRSPKV